MTATRRDTRYLGKACRSAEEGPLRGCAPDLVSRRVARLPACRRLGAESGHSERIPRLRAGKLLAPANGPAANGSRSRGQARTRLHSTACARVAARPLRHKLAPAGSDRSAETCMRPAATRLGPVPRSRARQRAEQRSLWDVTPETRKGRRTTRLGRLHLSHPYKWARRRWEEGFPLGSDPAGAQGPADDVHWPAPRSHPHTWRPCSALRRPLLRVVPAPCSTLHRPACVQRDSARTQLRPSDLAR
jgi:hypothetical protein